MIFAVRTQTSDRSLPRIGLPFAVSSAQRFFAGLEMWHIEQSCLPIWPPISIWSFLSQSGTPSATTSQPYGVTDSTFHSQTWPSPHSVSMRALKFGRATGISWTFRRCYPHSDYFKSRRKLPPRKTTHNTLVLSMRSATMAFRSSSVIALTNSQPSSHIFDSVARIQRTRAS